MSVELTFLLLLLPLFGVGASEPAAEDDPTSPDPAKFIVWGPGLRSDFHMPVRYFYIQTVARNGQNITQRLPDIFQIMIRETTHKRPISTYTLVNYLYDGKYIFLMRMHHSLEHFHLNITLMYKKKTVSDSPIYLRMPVYSEACDCPNRNFTEWLDRMECPKTFAQIDEDFKAFSKIDMTEVVATFEREIFRAGSVSACRYIIRNNKIFRKCYGQHVGFNTFSDAILISLTRKVVLPDMDFLWNLGDWPLSRKSENYRLPIVSWGGSTDTHDIVVPTYELTESILEMMGRVSVDIFSVISQSYRPWRERSDVAFFRGRDSSEERLKLVRLSLVRSDVLDARLTNMFFFQNDSTLGNLAEHVSFFDFFQHKFQVSMDGTVAAYRLPFLLAGGSLVLKQASQYYEHFYSMLTPGKHFLPLRRDIEDIMTQLTWARSHDSEARKIAEAARDFALEKLSPHHVFCYYARVFQRYADTQQLPSAEESPGPGFERITKTDFTRQEDCDCGPARTRHDEL